LENEIQVYEIEESADGLLGERIEEMPHKGKMPEQGVQAHAMRQVERTLSFSLRAGGFHQQPPHSTIIFLVDDLCA